MRKKITLGLFLFTKLLFSQQDPTSQNPTGMSNTASPNAAGFMRFQESPVNYYNGRSSFYIPIYEINVGGIKYPISLNYAHGGIQVNSMASDVGLGWSLTSTFINRTVVGDADLETIVDTRQYNEKVKNGYFTSGSYAGYGIVDLYPDIFNFVSPISSNKFFYKSENQPVELDQKDSQINWSIGFLDNNYLKKESGTWINNDRNYSDYNGFEITTKNGIFYSFENKDITHSFSGFPDYYEYDTREFGGITGTYPRVSTWNISKIKNLNNNEEINFSYETYSAETTNYINEIVSNHPYYNYESICPSASVEPYQNNLHYGIGRCNNGGLNRYYNRMLVINRIKKISFRDGSIEFNYAKLRDDLPNGKALTGIIVKDTFNNIIKEFEFDYDYFYSNPSYTNNGPAGYYGLRLKLKSVREKGHNKYEFDYYENERLPEIGSSLQDIFGYNNFPPTNEQFAKLYYYPNKSQNSLLPYYIEGENSYALDVGFYKEPNDLSKIWSLKKVTFPTGGSSSYVLESNTFNLWGKMLKGGGVRIQQQIIEEKPGVQAKTINYHYNKDANNSSGYLFNMPLIGYPTSILTQNELTKPWLKNYFLYYSSAKVNYDLVNNFFVGYSKVEEIENGIKTVFEFTNDEYPNVQTRSTIPYVDLTGFPSHPMGTFLISNSSYGSNFYIDNSHKRGKLKFTYYYDKDGHLVMQKENHFSNYITTGTNVSQKEFYAYGTSVYTYPSSTSGNTVFELMQFKKSYNTIYNNLVYTKTTKYLPSGNVEDENYMYYDTSNQNLTAVAHKIGNGVTYPNLDVKKYYYPVDIRNNATSFTPDLAPAGNLMDINKNDIPVLTQSYSGEIDPANIGYIAPWNMTSQSKILFSNNAKTSNMILPTQAMAAVGQAAFYEAGTFDRYDSKGNLLQTTKNGVSTTYLYGYNQRYPIAKIEGATYENVLQALNTPVVNSDSYLQLNIVKKSDLDKDQTSENDLIAALDTFRKEANLAGYAITTFTYNPLVGLTSVTPPSGMRDVYVYEAVTNKLKEVKRMEKDPSGNDVYRTLKEYEYHYKQP